MLISTSLSRDFHRFLDVPWLQSCGSLVLLITFRRCSRKQCFFLFLFVLGLFVQSYFAQKGLLFVVFYLCAFGIHL